MSENKIVVYSTPSCPYCTKVKNYLNQKDVEFEDFNVASNREKAKEMIQKTGQRGVPVTEINGEIIVGFNKPAIDQALEKSN
ncbi:MAG: glutaredoxin family protein [Candidatus Aenigmatarchaeota archaeon]